MTSFTILLGGIVVPTPRLLGQVSGTRAIAADGGIRHATPLGLAVELWVGDFDSSEPTLVARHASVPRQTHSPDKDLTDGALAIAEAVARGASRLVLAGGLGGQTDHAFGHLLLALAQARAGREVLVTSGAEEAVPLLPGRLRLELPSGSRLSIVPLADLEGLTIEGARWPLERANVEAGSTLTLSNVALGPVVLTLERGHGLVLAMPAA